METGKEWGDVEQQHQPAGGHQSQETSEKQETSEELELEEEGLSWGCGFDMNLSVQPVVVSSVLITFSTESNGLACRLYSVVYSVVYSVE